MAWDAKQPFGHEMPLETPTAGLPAFTFDLRFPGQRFDEETGLLHNGFRDYHPGLGRYVQSDPLRLEAGWNTYGYAGGNPGSNIDPMGLDWMNDISTFLYNIDEAIVQGMAKVEMPMAPQSLANTTAGWGDTLTTVPFTDFSLTRKIRSDNQTSGFVNCGSNEYSLGQVGGMANGLFFGGAGGLAGYAKLGQRGVPSGMARVTRWGRPGLKDGDWVMLGSQNKANWWLSGLRFSQPFKSSSTHIVPKSNIVSPLTHRPANEPAIISHLKEFFLINKFQKIYKE